MRIQLVFQLWLDKDGRPLPNYSTKGSVPSPLRCLELMLSDFHVLSTFDAKIELDEDAAADLRAALDEGYAPMFYAVPNEGSGWIPVNDRLPSNDQGMIWACDAWQGVYSPASFRLWLEINRFCQFSIRHALAAAK